MPIIGLNINKISAERKENAFLGKGLEIKTQPQITDVRETKLEGLSKENIDILSIGFAMSSTFNPDAGSILIEGSILYKSDKKDAILKEWKKAKALPSEDGVIVLNHIFNKASIIGLYLADLLSLPPIISLPRVEPRRDYDKTSQSVTPTQEKKN
ncbi:Uncharacterised protein [uncultured archaeon]|nr:Uncharacterised protein [uncultured archaeon]